VHVSRNKSLNANMLLMKIKDEVNLLWSLAGAKAFVLLCHESESSYLDHGFF
jgi:hypothetical protein